MDPLAATAERWRKEAEVLRTYGAEALADAAERHADELEDARAAYWREELTVEEAAEESDYTPSYLRDLVRRGAIPDLRPEGSQARIKIRREDLPRKPGGLNGEDTPDSDVTDLLDRIGS